MKFLFSVKSTPQLIKLATISLLLISTNLNAQLDNPDWGDGAPSCVTDALLYPGVAAVTCAVVEDVDSLDRYVIAYLSMNDGLSAVGRDTITNPDSVLHHSDWLVSNIGNVFGTVIKQSTAEVFVTASSNYGSGFGFSSASPAVLNYGVIGSPANATEAAGTVYRIDPITGAATVFVRLPQQTTLVEHWDCEDDLQEVDRTDTGVGLGNITYDELNDQYFVTNVEDGRIYRISSAGVILDSYDPLIYDTGVAGIADLEDIPYGIVVEPGSNRLFFGVVDAPGPGPFGMQALPGDPGVYSIDLNSSGGFVGTIDNTVLPAGATYNNYVGTDVLHSVIPTSQPGGAFSYTNETVYFISDLAFNQDGELMVGVRVGCHGSWHSSYNHHGETDFLTLNTMTNLYGTPTEYDISVLGDAGNEDSYGGVATYDPTNGTCDVYYASSSADIIQEEGPHGVTIWESSLTNNPITPIGVFQYGVLENDDPKGIGGDIEIFNGCSITCNITGNTTVCEGENVTLTYTPDCPANLFTWQITSGDATIVGANDQTTVTITAGSSDYTASLIPTGSSTTCTYDVTVTALVNPTVSGGPFCVNDAASNLTGSPAGGTFSGTGITDGAAGTFDPATAGVGTHTITYTIPGICMESATTDVVVNALPVVSISGGPFCVDDAASNLTASPAGGTFSGTGITDGAAGTFDPATAGAGTHTITYSFTDGNGCSNSAMTDVVVNALPIVSVSGGPFCIDDAASNLTASPAGGTFSGTGITDGAAGTFDPATAGAGTHTITYNYTDGNGCSNSAMTDVVVNALPVVSVSGGPFCIDDAASNLTASPAGGTFSGTGITDGAAGTFDPATAGAGTHTITYTFTDGNGCSNSAMTNVVVNALPVVSVSGGPFCIDDAASNLTASPAGGTFSGTGITDGAAGTFDPATAGAGTHTITYNYTDGNGCSNSAMTNVVVNALPVVSVSGGPFCIDDAASNLTASPAGGSFSGTGITDGAAGTFDPATAGVGSHTITYNYTDGNGCSNSAMTNVVVNALPIVSVSGGPFCVDDAASNLTASPVGGTFSGTGITDGAAGTFDPATAGAGTHTITYNFTDANGCSNSAMTDVVVNALPVVSVSGGPFCIDDAASNLTASPAGGTFSGTGITDAAAGTFDPATAGSGAHTITYSFTDANGCSNSAMTDVVVNALPLVSVSGGPFCIDDAASNLTASPAGGTFSGTGIIDAAAGTFDPATAGTGTHTITYNYTDGNGCSNSAMTDVVVNALPVVSVSGGPFCIDDAAGNLTASPAGGTFSGTGITDAAAGTFDPAMAGAGTHTITYNFTDGNGCSNSAMTDVVVNALPVVSVSGGPFCIDDAASNLTASPAGGTFSGTGITDAAAGTFDPAMAGAGTHTITYSFTDANGCSNSAMTDVVVNALPLVSVSGGPFCIDDAASNLTASPAGGTFSGTGITDAAAGTFDPATAGTGTHTITYNFTDGNGCSNSAMTNVVVNALPVVSVSGGPFCVNDAASNLTASPAGGTFSGTGITDAAAGTFDPATAGAGSHTITYNFTDGNGCSNSAMTDVVVNALPVVSVSGGPFCIDDAASNLTASPAGGTFSGTGITDAAAGTFDPAMAGAGTHTITYSFTDANGCSNSAMTDVVVNALPLVSVSGGPFCIDDAASNLTASPAGGTFSGTGITDAAAGTFDPATAGVGSHTITYNYTDGNGCSNSAMTDVVVNALPVVSVSGGPFCIDDAASNLTASPAGGTFSGTGITDGAAGTFDPATAGAGTNTITYNFTDGNGCSNSAMTDVVVNPLPIVSVTGGTFCIDDMPVNFTASPTGGVFSGPGITDSSTGAFDPAIAGVGSHNVRYDYIDANGCMNSAADVVIVNALPVVTVSGGPFCIDDAATNLTGSPAGGTFSGTGITDGSAGTFDPATAGVGTHTITYDYTDGNGCMNSAMTDVIVNPLPVVSVSGGPFCVDAAASNLTANPIGGTFSGTGITDASAGTFDPATAGAGTHTITYTYTDGNGCINSAMTDVIVNPLPTVSLSGGVFCIDDAASNLIGSPIGGAYSGTGITDASAGTFDPATAGAGTHTITYEYEDINGCMNSAMTDVVVNPLPIVSVSGGPFCIDETPTNLTASPVGGTFSGTGITDAAAGTFDPATAGAGTHTITYDYTDANGCMNSAMTDVVVNPLPIVSVSGGPFCIDEAPTNLTASPTGGTFSGPGITDAAAGTFDPATAGAGTHTITYDYTDANGCMNSAMTDVIVNPLPVVSVSGGPFCIDETPTNLTASPTGGTFSGPGITDAAAGTFDPVTAGAGTHTITYDYTDANGCMNSAMTDVIVNPLPVVSVSGGPFCIDESPTNLTASPIGGTYSGTGITDAAAGTFDPATAGAGTHTITYDYTDANGCMNSAMTDVIVNPLPVVSVSGGPFCIDEAPTNLTASPVGGTFSGTGITDAAAGTFDPATAGAGTHTITYDYTDANGCMNSAMTDVIVNPLPVVSVSGGPFCIDETPTNLTASPTGGTFSGPGITDAAAGTFDPATAGAGTHTITYDYTDANGCMNTAMTDVIVNPLPVVSVSGGPFCIDETPTNLTASPTGGTFSGPGITEAAAGTFDPATAGAGTHTITYDYTDANGCMNTAMTDVIVNPLPVVSVSGGPFCVDEAASNLAASPTGGNFSGPGITDVAAGTFDPATAGVGAHTITYDYTDANGCMNTAMTDVIVNALPTPMIDPILPSCIGNGNITLTANPMGGTFSGTGIIDGAGGIFDPKVAMLGTHTITYDYTDANGCFASTSIDIEIINCFDLALNKIIDPMGSQGPFILGDQITFIVTVYNQGQTDAIDVVVEDYLPSYMTFVSSPDFVFNGSSYLDTIPLLAAGMSQELSITLELTSYANLDVINNAEIISADDDNDPMNTPPEDQDSDLDLVIGSSDDDTEIGTDNDIDDEDPSQPGIADNLADQDDYDPSVLPILDLANTKTVNAASLAAAGGTFEPNETIIFEVNVFNQGNVVADNITITDTIPCGLAYDDLINDATGWVLSGSGGAAMFTVGSLNPGADTTIQISFSIKSSAQVIADCGASPTVVPGEPFTNFTFIQSAEVDGVTQNEDVDSEFDSFTPEEANTNPNENGDDDTNSTGNDQSGSQDDNDPAIIEIFDLALSKIVSPLDLPYKVGETITFEICVSNQGNVPTDSVNIVDYIPAGLEYNTASNALGWTGTPGMSQATFSFDDADLPGGTLDFGEQVCTDIILTILSNQTDFVNRSEITSATSIVDDGMGGTLTSLVTNDNDSTFDNIPADEAGGAPDTESDAMTSNTNDPAILGDGTGNPGEEIAAEDDDSSDPTLVPIVDFALRKKLADGNTTPFAVGDTVRFLIEVLNQGNVGGSNITINDYIPSNLAFVDVMANDNWTGAAFGQSDITAMTTIAGPIEPGEIDSVYVELEILAGGSGIEDYTNSAEIFRVFAAPSAPAGVTPGSNITTFDVDSTPDAIDNNDNGSDASSPDNPNNPNPADDYVDGNGLDPLGMPDDGVQATDEDDADPAMVAFHDVALTKTKPMGLGPVDIGQVITFTITVYNQGNSPVDSVSIIDYIPAGYTFVPNNNWVPSGMNATLTATVANSLITGGGIPVGGSQDFPLELTISSNATLDNLVNVAEITGSRDLNDLTQDDDDDSTADMINGNDPGGSDDTPSDDVVDGDGSGTPGDEVAATDEDDSDPEGVELALYSLGNQVWLDDDNSGTINGTEAGIENVTVELYDAGGMLVETTMTDDMGLYLFDSLVSGEYTVVIPSLNFGMGAPLENLFSSTGGGQSDLLNGPSEDDLSALDPDTDLDDNDDNGVLDGNPTYPGAVVSTAITLGGVVDEPTGENPDNDPLTLDENENLTVDFGFVPLVSIGSNVFIDNNNDGEDDGDGGIEGLTVEVYDAGPDMMIGGGDDILVGFDVTDVNGDWAVDSLLPGNYYALIPTPDTDYPNSSTPTDTMDNGEDGDDNGTQLTPGGAVTSPVINLSPNDENAPEPDSGGGQDSADDNNGDMTVDFGFPPLMSIGSTVFYDQNDDGVQDLSDPLESGIEGVQVDLYYDADNNGMIDGAELTPIASVDTDVDGNYIFGNLLPGNYQVGVPTPDESAQTSSTGQNTTDNEDLSDDGDQSVSGGPTLSPIVNLEGGQEPTEDPANPGADQDDADELNGNMTVDFGFIPQMSLGSTVFYDPNDNGIQDTSNPLEDGIEGVTVNLYLDADGDGMLTGAELTPVETTVTDAEGDYLFTMLPEGDYIVGVDPTGGAPVSSTGQMTGDGIDGNDNGDQPGGSGTEILSNPVNLDGNMETHTEDFQGGDQDDADENNGDMTVDFGLVPNMSIGSTVFYDQNDDGVQDLTDPLEGGIENVQVDLYYDENNDGAITGDELTPVASTTTDAEGNYFFGNLPEGNYQVGVPTPDESAQTSSTGQNSTDNEDLSDDGDQPVSGGPTLSPIVNLEAGMEPDEDPANPGADQDDADELNGNMTVDFGFIPQMSLGSTVFYDPNDNGIQDTSNPLEDGIEGVTVNLYLDADGDGMLTGAELTPVEITVTDAEGDYLFTMLPEGDYIVGVDPTGGAPVSSTGQMTGDGIDGNDNGAQPGGSGTEILSNPVNLDGNMETHTEDFQGGDQDDADENNGDMTVDFGLVPNMSIGSTVFYDQNDDGVQDLTDPLEGGIENVQVDLYYDENNDGSLTGDELTPVASTTTDADGNYFFGNLPEGNYQVGVPTPDESAQASSTGQNTTDNEDLSDDGDQPVSGGPTLSPIVNLEAGMEPDEDPANPGADQDDADELNGNMTVDFGFIPQMSLGSTVFYDPNDNGIQDTSNPLEDGIEGVTVNLYLDADGDGMLTGAELTPVETTVTDAEGDYLFTMLPEGDYIVGVDPTGGAPVSSTGQMTGDGVDGNDNGEQPGGSGTEILSNPVNLDGNMETHTEDEQGGDQDDADENNGDMTVDFGLVPNMSIGSTVFYDQNDDGVQDLTDPLEGGIENVQVDLYYDENNDGSLTGDELTPVASTTTDADGNYFFGNLPEGNYQVGVPTPDESAQTSSTGQNTTDNEDLSDDGDQPVSGGPTLSPIVNLEAGMEPDEDPANPGADQDDADELNGNMTVDFGFIPQMSLGSTVFYDPNDNGIQDTSNPLEDGIEGVTVNLYLDADGDGMLTGAELTPVETTVTDAKGDYLFTMLPEGDYIVGVDPTGGAPVSSTGQMTGDGVDGNDNGDQPGGSGTEILSNPVNLDGNMETHTEDEQGGNQDDADENNGDMTVDFGLVPNMSIGSTVFYDQNDDGVQDLTDPLEGGIENVQVDLYYDENNDGSLTGDELTPVASTTTDADGNYFFGNLPEGNYQVGIPTPDESAQTSSTGQNTTDNEDLSDDGDQPLVGGPTLSPIVNLEAGMEPDEDPANPGADQDDADELNGNMTVDFGFIPQMSLGSTVFYDPNDNGIQDTSNPLEDGIEGVTVNLYLDADGDGMLTGAELTPVETTVTDAEGDYLFTMLPEGDYIVGVDPTGGAPVSSTGQMTGDGIDGNDNGDQPGGSGTEILSNPVNLDGNMETHTEDEQGGNQDDADENNGDMTVDFGLVPNMSIGSTVFYDQNDDGVQDLTDPLEGGIENVQVDLYYDENNDGSLTGDELTPVASTTTDADGNYFFGNLPEGNYQISVPTPDESAQTSSTGQNTTDNEDLSDDGDQPVSGGPTLSPMVNLEAGMEPDEDSANPGADQDDADELNGNMTVDFGFIPQMSLGSTVFYDPNDNGVQDTSNPLEAGIDGVTVNLYFDEDGDGMLMGDELIPVESTVTDSEGNYLFTMLPEGDYIVGIDPTGDAPVSSTGQMTDDGIDGNDNGEQPGGSGTEVLSNPVNLDGNMETHTEDEQGGNQDDADENNGDMTIDFGLIPNMSIGSTVFLDNNDDGMQDPLDDTETGIPNVTVQLLFDADGNGIMEGDELTPVATTMTDSNGDYFFGMLPEGNYQVVIPTAPASAPTSSTPTDSVDNGEDGDDNGAQPGGAGTEVTSPIINLTPTEEPEDDEEMGQGGMQDNNAASPDDNGDMTIDFGFIPYVSVGSNVFVDENNDGIDQGDDEEGIEGITVEVYSTGPDMMIGGGDDILVGMDVTDVNGDWLVDSLTPGEYYAVIDMVDPIYPTSSTTDFDADDEVDNNDNGVQAGGSGTSVISNEFTLTGDAETTAEPGPGGDQDNSDDDNGDMTVDFGFVPYYSLGNQVWIDDNYDGLINGSEVGIDGVDVELYDTDGNLVDMTVTMNGGMYLFDSLLPGDYIVVIPASELAPGGTLQDYLSSTGTFNMGGPFEDPGVDAETNADNDDNGTYDTNGDYPQAVVSSVVTLGGDDEPLNEDPDNDPNTLDQYENLTVDFGFIEKVYDVALIKETDMETGNKVGDILTFTITVSNQGNTPLTNIEVTDYIASGFLDVPGQNSLVTDAGGSGWSAEVDGKITYVIGDTLAPNESTEITVYLELGLSLESGAYVNYGEVSMFQDTIGNSTDGTGPYVGGIEDEDSTPDDTNEDPGGQPNSDADDYVDGDGTGVIGDGVASTDEDDHDPAMIQVVDIALAKTVLTAGPYEYGQEVEFNIEVTNQGNVDLEDILVSDYIPCGMTFGPSNSNWSVSSDVATTTIEALAAGASTNLSIYFTVIPVSGSCAHDEAYVNYAEVSMMFADYDGDGIFDDDVSEEDVDSEADSIENNDAGGEPQTDSDDYVEGDGSGGIDDGTDTTDEDDHDPAFINIFDLAQIKFIDDEGPYDIGEVATFEFEVTNQGNVDAYNIVITDYLSEGFSFSTMGNDGWSESGDNLEYTIDGPLAPGETATVFLDLTVILPDNASVLSWYNESEISSADDDTNPDNDDPTDADSTPNDNPDDDNDLVDGPDDDPIFDPDDDNDNVIDENPNDPFGIGDDDEDDNDAAGVLVVGGLGDTVWKDVNGDGIQDPDEEGVEGVVVTLTDCEGNIIGTQTTDENGFYFFNNLIPGDYQVQFDISNLPVGCAFTPQDQGDDDELDSDVDDMGFAPCTNIQGGEYDSTFDAGLFILPDIGDFVWHDTDGDGVQDPNEPGIEDVMVLLYNEDNELIQVTITESDGSYLFPDVYPDTYYIVFVDPDGFESTFPNTTDDENDSDITNFVFTEEGSTTDLFDVVFGQEDDLSFDAGYYMCVPIGELVWYDVSEDDIKDPTENGINGLEVKLYRFDGAGYVLWEETVTGHKPGTPSDDGYYKFCAPPGTYYIEMIMPPIGLVQAQSNAINNLPLTNPNESVVDSDLTNNFGQTTTASFTVSSGDQLCNIGAGFYPMATVGNRVWEDSNENGYQDDGEADVANVLVEAFEVASGNKIAESTTNSSGIYKIEYLKKEDYYLKFTPPNGYGFTIPNVGGESVDSDVDHSYGFRTTSAYSMEPGENYINVDAGLKFGVLPVVWASVDAEHKGDHNLVTWETASEVNTDVFVVERSLDDGFKFEAIGEVAAAGESVVIRSYEFKDGDVRPGTYYYRIKQVDKDGKFEYSDIVSVNIASNGNLITLAPNPAHGKSILSIDLESGKETSVKIFGSDGRLIKTYDLEADSGNGISTTIEINDLPTGIYSVSINQGTFKDVRKLIIIE